MRQPDRLRLKWRPVRRLECRTWSAAWLAAWRMVRLHGCSGLIGVAQPAARRRAAWKASSPAGGASSIHLTDQRGAGRWYWKVSAQPRSKRRGAGRRPGRAWSAISAPAPGRPRRWRRRAARPRRCPMRRWRDRNGRNSSAGGDAMSVRPGRRPPVPAPRRWTEWPMPIGNGVGAADHPPATISRGGMHYAGCWRIIVERPGRQHPRPRSSIAGAGGRPGRHRSCPWPPSSSPGHHG